MATSFNKLENKVQLNYLHVKRFHMVKRLRKSVQYIKRYLTKYTETRREHATQFPSVSLFSAQTIYWTDLHQNFTQYSGISAAIKSRICIFTALYHFVSECQSDESAEFALFHKIGCCGNVPWVIGKRGPDRSFAPKTISFDEKIAKIGPSDPEIIVSEKSLKKKKKQRKEITEGKIYSPVGNLAKRAKLEMRGKA